MGIRFDESRRRYIDDQSGREYPGITWILRKSGLLPETPPPKEALERGRRVHMAIQYDIEGTLDEDSILPEDWPYVLAMRRAFNELGLAIRPDEVEKLVINPALGYGTAIDALALWRGKRTVVNWKTGGSELPHYRIQSALEALAVLSAMVVPECVRRLNIHLLADGAYRAVVHEDDSDFDVARAACVIANWKVRQKGEEGDE